MNNIKLAIVTIIGLVMVGPAQQPKLMLLHAAATTSLAGTTWRVYENVVKWEESEISPLTLLPNGKVACKEPLCRSLIWKQAGTRLEIKDTELGWPEIWATLKGGQLTGTARLGMGGQVFDWRATKAAAIEPVSVPSQAGLPLPYEDHGACPFECCTYRRWTVSAQTRVRQARQNNSPVAFTLQRGERVVGMTGVVITTTSGQARALKAVAMNGVRVKPGEVVYLLSYRGEGFYKAWYRGKLEDLEISEDAGFKLLKEPQTIWWVQVKNSKGQLGWTDQTTHFSGMDSCG